MSEPIITFEKVNKWYGNSFHVLRDIDLSVAAIIALASTAMGAAAAAGAPTLALVPLGALVGLACGALNGWLVTRFAVPALIVTIGTMSLFRGISFIILGDKAYNGYPADFAWFGQGYVWWVFSFELVFLLALAGFMYAVKRMVWADKH